MEEQFKSTLENIQLARYTNPFTEIMFLPWLSFNRVAEILILNQNNKARY